MKNKDRLVFWARFSIYTIFGVVIPVVFLIIRFKLFQKISSLSIGGWGIVAIMIVAFSFVSMLKYIKKGIPFSFVTQCINGVIKVIIPLLVTLLIINSMKNSINELINFLVVFIGCQIIAIPANPFPKWMHDHQVEDRKIEFKKIFKELGLSKGNGKE